MANEALTDVLEELGYNVVSMPSDNIFVRDLLYEQQGYLKPLGKLGDLFKPGDTHGQPAVQEEVSVPNQLEGSTSRQVDAQAGISLLENIFKKIGISGGSMRGAFAKAKSFTFKFENLSMDEMSLIKLDQFVNDAEIIEDARSSVRQLEQDDVYVVTAVLKSSKISIGGQNESEGKVEVELPEIKNAVSAEAKIEKKRDGDIEISYQGEKKLVFAVQAVRLLYDKKGWFRRKPSGFRIRATQGMVVRGDENIPVELLPSNKGVRQVKEEDEE